MNIFKKIRIGHMLSRKTTFRVMIEETPFNKKVCEYYYKILPKKGFIMSEIDGTFTSWCNPKRITKIGFADEKEFYADDSPTALVTYYQLSPKVCERCLKNEKCKTYSNYIDEKIKRTVWGKCLKERCEKYQNLIDQEIKHKKEICGELIKQGIARENCLKEGLE